MNGKSPEAQQPGKLSTQHPAGAVHVQAALKQLRHNCSRSPGSSASLSVSPALSQAVSLEGKYHSSGCDFPGGKANTHKDLPWLHPSLKDFPRARKPKRNCMAFLSSCEPWKQGES